jgi:hypothetical protein
METKKENWEVLVNDILQNKKYGDFISHRELSSILKMPINDKDYHHVIGRANKYLTEKGRRLKNVYKAGYMVLEPDRYIEEAERKFKAGTRRAKEALAILVYAPVELMSIEAKENYRMAEKTIRQAVVLAIGGLTEVKLLNRPKLLIK